MLKKLGTGFTETADQQSSGGNPDVYRQMLHTWGGGTQVIIYHTYVAGTYDPGIDGAIDTIDYSEDQIKLAGAGTIGRGMIAVQDGVFYRTIGSGFGMTR